MPDLKTPVVFIIFNRPDLTELVFREIARARPPKLLVIADGPRPDRPGEAEKCAAARKIVERIDWDCEVLTHFSDTNLGCKRRVSSGITWAFSQVEEAIILEDDIVPGPSFFEFCETMLERYRDDPRIMMISGSSFLGRDAPEKQSYYLSEFPLIWGWAGWRRSWRSYDVEMPEWPSFRDSERFKQVLPSLAPRFHFRRQVDRTYAGAIDTWDTQWCVAVWRMGGLCVNSTRNLVRNVGFGPEATHTHFYDPMLDMPVEKAEFPLRPPVRTDVADTRLDMRWLERHHSPIGKIWRRIRQRVFPRTRST